MVEGGSGAGAAGGASTAFVAPVASIEASAPAFAPAPDVAPTAEAPVGGADVTAVVPDGGHAGEAQSAQVATDADRLEDVQDRLAQQSGQTAEDRPADGASDGDPAVQASAAGEPLPADQAGAGETVSAEEVAAKGETPAEGEAAAGKQVDEGETPVSVEGDASGEAGAPTEPAAEGEGGAGDLEFADPATIAEVGLDTRQTRLALEILAGKLNVHSAAARVIHAELDEAMKDLPQDASRAQKAWRFFTKATVVPRAAQRLGTSGAKKEVSSNAGKHGAEANAIAERALQIMLHGTPTEQAFALDAQIALAKASLMTVSGDAEAKIKAQIEGLSAQRGSLTLDGKTIPNQMQSMALQFATMFEPGGRVPPDAIANPLAYMQRVYGNAVSTQGSAHEFFSEFASQGMIAPEDVKSMTKTFALEWNGPSAQVLLAAAKGSVGIFFAFLASLYFKMKGQGGRGRAAV